MERRLRLRPPALELRLRLVDLPVELRLADRPLLRVPALRLELREAEPREPVRLVLLPRPRVDAAPVRPRPDEDRPPYSGSSKSWNETSSVMRDEVPRRLVLPLRVLFERLPPFLADVRLFVDFPRGMMYLRKRW